MKYIVVTNPGTCDCSVREFDDLQDYYATFIACNPILAQVLNVSPVVDAKLRSAAEHQGAEKRRQ